MKKLDDKIARTTAKFLLEINAIHFNSVSPFTLTSGLKSPVYIDCRKLISYPKGRNVLIYFCSYIVVYKIVGYRRKVVSINLYNSFPSFLTLTSCFYF